MILPDLTLNLDQYISFPMVNPQGLEVAGLGTTFTVQYCKPGTTVFLAGGGVKAEVGLGWYRYSVLAAEVDTPGQQAFVITAPGALQQNLLYIVGAGGLAPRPFTYTVFRNDNVTPIAGVEVWITPAAPAATPPIWRGYTDALGVARDTYGQLPFLNDGTHYFW